MIALALWSVLTSLVVGVLLLGTRGKAAKRKGTQAGGVSKRGGLGIYVATFATVLLAAWAKNAFGSETAALLLGGTLMMALGWVDDTQELSPWVKLLGQVGVAVVVVLLGVRTQILWFHPVLNGLLTVLWIVALTNAINLIDIEDGLAAGTAAIIGATLLVLALLEGNVVAVILASALVGALVAFLRLNLPPASLWMGDTGSLLVGFCLAVLGISIGYANEWGRQLSLLTPLLVFGFPLFDMLFLMLMRMREGKSLVRKSPDHFALRLKRLGYGGRRGLLIMYGLAAIFCGLGLFFKRASSPVGLVMLLGYLVGLVLIGRRLSHVELSKG